MEGLGRENGQKNTEDVPLRGVNLSLGGTDGVKGQAEASRGGGVCGQQFRPKDRRGNLDSKERCGSCRDRSGNLMGTSPLCSSLIVYCRISPPRAHRGALRGLCQNSTVCTSPCSACFMCWFSLLSVLLPSTCSSRLSPMRARDPLPIHVCLPKVLSPGHGTE